MMFNKIGISLMSKKFYVIWKGLKTGIFTSWTEVKQNIEGRSDAQYMGFPSQGEAEQAFKSSYTQALMKRSLAKGKTNTQASSTTKHSTAIKNSRSPNSYVIDIYCDGACSPNPGKSGTGIAVYKKNTIATLWYGLYQANGTNNTAELNGMLEAFKLAQTFLAKDPNLEKQIQVLSDSKYSIDCITKWAKGWQAKGWTRGKGETIKNLALIQSCYALYLQLKNNIIISHVKGHANIEGNELADRMAVLARCDQQEIFIQYQNKIDVSAILAMPSG